MDISPTFSSKSIELRPFTPDDLEALMAYLNHPELTGRRYIPWEFPDDIPLSHSQVEGILKKWGEKKKGFVLGIILRETGALIGHAEADWQWDSHCPDIGMAIDPTHQRQGYGTEVLILLLTYLFDHTPAHNVAAGFAVWNEAAREFAAKNGFTESGTIRRDGIRDGDYFDAVIVDILRPEWKAIQGG
jgi:RimJ/RimL family protein N-acetyltransferase